MRFGFVLWLRHLTDGLSPTFADIGRSIGRTGPSVGAWMKSQEAPLDFRIHQPLCQCLGIEEKWFIRGEGQPPEAELWLRWLEARGSAAGVTNTVVKRMQGTTVRAMLAERGSDGKRKPGRR